MLEQEGIYSAALHPMFAIIEYNRHLKGCIQEPFGEKSNTFKYVSYIQLDNGSVFIVDYK